MQSSKIKISVQKSKFLILPFTFALCLLNFNLAFAAPWSLDLVSAVAVLSTVHRVGKPSLLLAVAVLL